ncbi:MAG TPA: TPM domain-containing protein, partial [Patescibacteria group bacterium]|nr:TPM domain-containing protein [Patescibacteria group bacterium]
MTKFLAVLAATLLSLTFTTAARAQDCDRMVVDGANKLGAGGIATVESAGNRLVNSGADVRVRVIPKASDYGNLDRWKADMQQRCASWQSGDGGMKNNLVVVVISMDRQAGIYFGSQYRRALEGRTASIRTDKMNPRFRDNDFAGGLVNGLDAARDLIVAANAPPVTAPPPAAPPPVIVQTGPPAQPTDYSGLWSVMGWGLGLVAIGLIVFGIVYWSRVRAKRRAAQQKAQATRSSCAGRITELDDPISLAAAKLAKAAKNVSEEDAAPLRTRLDALKAAASKASAQYSDLQQSANNPDQTGLSEAEYDGMNAAFQGVLDALDGVRADREKLESDIANLQVLIDAAKPCIDALDKDIETAAAAIAKVQEQGFTTDAVESILASAVQASEEANTAFGNKRFGAVKGICDKGAKKAAEAKSAAEALPRRKAAIDGGIASLKGRLPLTQSAIDAGKATFGEISSTYADACWETIRGNGTEAVKRLKSATQAVEDATQAATMDHQEWQNAEAVIAGGNKALDEAESLMRSIASLKGNLDAAKRDAQPEIDAAQADIDKAVAYERQYDDDIRDSIKDDIVRAKRILEGARAELAKAKPDYFKVVGEARKANAAADKILEESRSEHEAAERQRQRAVSSVRDAASRISAAKEYMEDHSSDVESGARQHLADAKRQLAEAERTQDLASRIRLAEDAEEKAKKALSSAKSDVKDAEDERQRQREAAAAAAAAERARLAEAERERQRAADLLVGAAA